MQVIKPNPSPVHGAVKKAGQKPASFPLIRPNIQIEKSVKALSGFVATVPKGMELYLEEELRTMGASQIESHQGRIHFEADLKTAYHLILNTRIANRVLKPLIQFHCLTPEDLYEGVQSIDWSTHLDVNGTLAVDFSCTNSHITHSQYGALKTKDAIVDQFREKTGERPSVNTAEPDLRINVYLRGNQAIVSLDLSGGSLHERGYREMGVAAPLKENLAAALLCAAEWPKKLEEGYSFLDPMCGSGTLVLEAALMAYQKVPGLDRSHFGFTGWKAHQGQGESLWKLCVEEAIQQEKVREESFRFKKGQRIVGYDQNPKAIQAALLNREAAELDQYVHFEKRVFDTLEPISEKGILMINPPYGERLGEDEEVKSLYKQIGDVMKQRFKGWTAYVLTGNLEAAKHIGLKASRRMVFFNGPIECRLLRYELF